MALSTSHLQSLLAIDPKPSWSTLGTLDLESLLLVLGQRESLVPHALAEPHVEVHLIADPSVEPVCQPLPGPLLVLVLVLQSSRYKYSPLTKIT